jgi:hypothetical protein
MWGLHCCTQDRHHAVLLRGGRTCDNTNFFIPGAITSFTLLNGSQLSLTSPSRMWSLSVSSQSSAVIIGTNTHVLLVLLVLLVPLVPLACRVFLKVQVGKTVAPARQQHCATAAIQSHHWHHDYCQCFSKLLSAVTVLLVVVASGFKLKFNCFWCCQCWCCWSVFPGFAHDRLASDSETPPRHADS